MTDTFVAVDIETTGLNPGRNRIIEIGAIRVERGEIRGRFDTLVNPRCAIPSEIVELTGIDARMLLDAPHIEEAMEEFLAFAGEDVLLGHNLIFDYSFLKRNAADLGKKFERFGIDTLKIAKVFLPELKKKSLGALCAHYGVVNEHAHRAEDDALAAVRIYERMKEQFFEGGTERRKVFAPVPLRYSLTKESPITEAQVKYLKALLKYHKLSLEEDPESLTKSEASKRIDGIIFQYGKIQ
jgi:DNA polymerase-3 subunit alpha (Gram-positive type)